jgi:hypothetical protein
LEEAEQHYKIAEMNGISEAKFRLAGIRMRKPIFLRVGVPYTEEALSEVAAVKNMLRSAGGHADSQIFLADMLWEDYQRHDEPEENREQGLEEALVLLRLALEQGTAAAHARGLVIIADIYEYYKKDFGEAFQYRKQSSDRGCLTSRLKLAQMYRSGQGTICDVSEAVRLLKPMVDNLLADDSQVRTMDFDCHLETLRDIYLELGDNAEALKYCKAGADVGISECQFAAGCMYEGLDPRYEICFGIDGDNVSNVPLEGDAIEIDFCAAAEYYQLASDHEDKSGTSSLARMYEYGLGVEQSFTEAERLLKLAGDHDDAKLRLAHFYEYGREGAIAKNELKAFEMYQELVDFMGDESASCRLACMYRDGRGVPQNRSRAYDILNDEEVSQDANVCYLHASMLLEESHGPLRDTTKAMHLLKIAVLEDHTDAQYLLGRQLEDKRPRRAIKLLKKASRKQHVEATFRLACLIFDGEGLAQNYEAAAKLFTEIVAKGHVEASVRLAEMHECGNGVAQNIEIAVMLFTLAAEKGNPRAQCRLACLYRDGCGVLQDEKKAFKLFRLAALQGVPQAQYDLACMYLHGNGTVRSRSEANRWFHKAASQGYAGAAAPHQPAAVESV